MFQNYPSEVKIIKKKKKFLLENGYTFLFLYELNLNHYASYLLHWLHIHSRKYRLKKAVYGMVHFCIFQVLICTLIVLLCTKCLPFQKSATVAAFISLFLRQKNYETAGGYQSLN